MVTRAYKRVAREVLRGAAVYLLDKTKTSGNVFEVPGELSRHTLATHAQAAEQRLGISIAANRVDPVSQLVSEFERYLSDRSHGGFSIPRHGLWLNTTVGSARTVTPIHHANGQDEASNHVISSHVP